MATKLLRTRRTATSAGRAVATLCAVLLLAAACGGADATTTAPREPSPPPTTDSIDSTRPSGCDATEAALIGWPNDVTLVGDVLGPLADEVSPAVGAIIEDLVAAEAGDDAAARRLQSTDPDVAWDLDREIHAFCGLAPMTVISETCFIFTKIAEPIVEPTPDPDPLPTFDGDEDDLPLPCGERKFKELGGFCFIERPADKLVEPSLTEEGTPLYLRVSCLDGTVSSHDGFLSQAEVDALNGVAPPTAEEARVGETRMCEAVERIALGRMDSDHAVVSLLSGLSGDLSEENEQLIALWIDVIKGGAASMSRGELIEVMSQLDRGFHDVCGIAVITVAFEDCPAEPAGVGDTSAPSCEAKLHEDLGGFCFEPRPQDESGASRSPAPLFSRVSCIDGTLSPNDYYAGS